MSGNYKVNSEVRNNVPIISIVGDMTSDADNSVVSTFSTIKENRGVSQIIFNFSETNYINSAGLATLINIIQEVEKVEGVVYFTGLTVHFQKVMDIVGITDFVEIVETDEDALSKLR